MDTPFRASFQPLDVLDGSPWAAAVSHSASEVDALEAIPIAETAPQEVPHRASLPGGHREANGKKAACVGVDALPPNDADKQQYFHVAGERRGIYGWESECRDKGRGG